MARTLCVDPGETVGWSVWNEDKLLGGGQTPLWEFAFDVKDAVENDAGPLAQGESGLLHVDVKPEENTGAFELFVIEKFALYPDKAKELAWDEFRTSQLIGALTLIAADNGIPVHKQPASIKARAMAGGAKELFVKPLHENRHQNDSIMHGFFYNQVERKKTGYKVKDGANGIKRGERANN